MGKNWEKENETKVENHRSMEESHACYPISEKFQRTSQNLMCFHFNYLHEQYIFTDGIVNIHF